MKKSGKNLDETTLMILEKALAFRIGSKKMDVNSKWKY